MPGKLTFSPVVPTWLQLMQDINPVWNWWTSSMSQLGFVVINQMNTTKPEVEQDIVNDAASYGKQLGRIIDALNVICKWIPVDDLGAEDVRALEALAKMAAEIAAVKARLEPTAENLDRFEACLQLWRGRRRLKNDLSRIQIPNTA